MTRVVLPAALPNLFGGIKLALAYSFIGVIAGEFILSSGGLGYGIAYAYESFENRDHVRAHAVRAAGGDRHQRRAVCGKRG